MTFSTRLSKKNWFEREGMKRRIKRNSDNGRGDDQDGDDHHQEDGWMKKGKPELLL